MPFRRREEPLHERLSREGGLESSEPPTFDARPGWGEVGIHGMHRLREWDGVVTAAAPGLKGDAAVFVVLEDGTLLVEDDPGDNDLSVLSDAIEGAVGPPLRAQAVRQGADVWVVAANRLQVESIPEQVGGDEIVLSLNNGERTLAVDGRGAIQALPSLEALGETSGPSYTVVAHRLDEDLWEVEVSPL